MKSPKPILVIRTSQPQEDIELDIELLSVNKVDPIEFEELKKRCWETIKRDEFNAHLESMKTQGLIVDYEPVDENGNYKFKPIASPFLKMKPLTEEAKDIVLKMASFENSEEIEIKPAQNLDEGE